MRHTFHNVSTVFETLENKVLIALSALLSLTALFFIALQVNGLALFRIPGVDNDPFYIAFALFSFLSLAAVLFFRPLSGWRGSYKRLLFVGFPAWFILGAGLLASTNFHYIFLIGESLFAIAAGVYVSMWYVHNARKSSGHQPAPGVSPLAWVKQQGLPTLIIVVAATLVFGIFGVYRITEFAAVDEPLWLNGRIGKFWHRVEDRLWKGTWISDKPGITVALVSGPGLWFKTPKEYRAIKVEGTVVNNNRSDLEEFFLAFRLPIVLFATAMLPLFYFLLERLLGRRPALFSYVFLATTPPLIGMTKIVNPDSLLWIFTPLSLLAYLVYLKRHRYRYLIIGGILFGLALLTKYVANILFIFLFGLIFLEFLYHRRGQESFSTHLKRSLGELALFTFSALTTFYLLFPAVWIKPEKLITSTLYSQAFEKVAPLFLALLIFILADEKLNQARILTVFLAFLDRFKLALAALVGALFSFGILAAAAVSWSGMRLYNFQELLASPKTIASQSDFIGIFLTNFVPLIFGVIPIAFFLLLGAPIALAGRSFFLDPAKRTSFYLIIFILLYYLGATVNNVASITRYQIILFPVAAIIAGITLFSFWSKLKHRFPKSAPVPAVTALLVLGFGFFSLLTTEFPLSYASVLLPAKYHTDVKDMGPGSYEVAMWLNSKKDAENLLVWTDKEGVCKFFVGHCKSGRNYEALRRDGLDYIVVSSGRQSRTTKMMSGEIASQKAGLIRFDQYYLRTDPAFKVEINERPSHFVKVFKFQPAEQ